ncbi:MAG: peptidase M56 family protein, partial [Acidothermaceae bacterium]
VKIDDRFAAGLRAALVEHVRASPTPRRRRWRITISVGVAVLVTGGGVAAAAATGVLPLPGGDVVTPLAASVTVTGTGTQTVQLGTAPAGAVSIDIKLTCLTAGTFLTADGASMQCSPADASSGQTMGWHLPVQPGQHSTTIRAGAGERWRLVATYSAVATTSWGVNADGLTYGVANDHGTPDLVAVVATNGKTGYVYAKDLSEPAPANPSRALHWQDSPLVTIHLPVYEADGKTQVGVFDVHRRAASMQNGGGPPAMPPLSSPSPRSTS